MHNLLDAAEMSHDSPRITPSEITSTNETVAANDLVELCRWEDDGGPVGREDADGE